MEIILATEFLRIPAGDHPFPISLLSTFFYKANHFPISYPSQLLMQELFQIQISYWFKSSNSKSIDSYNDLDFRLNISTSLNLWLFKNYYFIPF